MGLIVIYPEYNIHGEENRHKELEAFGTNRISKSLHNLSVIMSRTGADLLR